MLSSASHYRPKHNQQRTKERDREWDSPNDIALCPRAGSTPQTQDIFIFPHTQDHTIHLPSSIAPVIFPSNPFPHERKHNFLPHPIRHSFPQPQYPSSSTGVGWVFPERCDGRPENVDVGDHVRRVGVRVGRGVFEGSSEEGSCRRNGRRECRGRTEVCEERM